MSDPGRCDVCGEILYADEEWILKPDRPEIGKSKDDDYIHKRCRDEYREQKQ